MNPKSKSASFLLIILSFAFGIVIGLVVLGWWLWPVQWMGASFDTLSFADQQSFLRTAIEAYAYNSDGGVAQERYNALGEQKERVLSEILINPGNLPKIEIERFANIVQAQPVAIPSTPVNAPSGTIAEPVAPTSPSIFNLIANLPGWLNILLPVACFLLVGLIIILIIFSRRKRNSLRSKPAMPEADESDDVLPALKDQGQASFAEYQTTATDNQQTILAENELPDWLNEVTQQPQPTPVESKPEARPVEFSDSDITAISNSSFASAETKTALPTMENGSLPALDFDAAYNPEAGDFFETPVQPQEFALPAEPIPTEQAETFDETPEETLAKFSQDIALTPGVSLEEANKLRAGGISAPLLLFRKAATPQGRQAIAAATGIPEAQILKWANFIDLLRIKGLSVTDAQILKTNGVDMLVELATRDPEALFEKINAATNLSDLTYRFPSRARIENWISQARELPRIITHM